MTEPWRDPKLPPLTRVNDLLARMTPAEKLAQLRAVWLGSGAAPTVAPKQHELIDPDLDWIDLITDGLGHLTRVFGTAPISAADGVKRLAALQEIVTKANRFGIPAIAHEECLCGFTTLGATIFATPLAWGASFNPTLILKVGAAIGRALAQTGVHQGLAPVLDVTRDPRWGRTEETIGEDPYLVGTIGTAYVRGLQSEGVISTLKHFAGYGASRAGRNLAPVSMGRRELTDTVLPPFEMAVRDGRAGSVMHSYSEVDGVPAAADRWLLTELLRDEWGFAGTVVADYFGVTFLHTLHGIAADLDDAGRLALEAGVDVELPMVHAFRQPHQEDLLDRACRRVLWQKCELGLLDPDWTPPSGEPDLNPPSSRALARQLAEESLVLLVNDGVLPLSGVRDVAVVGPLADDPDAMLGCYTFPRHVGLHHPETPPAIAIPTVLECLRERLPRARIVHTRGCGVSDAATDGIADAVEAARRADVCVVVLGDRSGLFGAGTSGEGCDAEDLDLPGVQGTLLDALLASGTQIVLVILSGRPYALGRFASRVAAIVQGFFPGQEGGRAVASLLAGDFSPGGRLPVSIPRERGGQPFTYLTPRLGHASDVSVVDPTPLFPFGHGLSYTTFEWRVDRQHVEISVDGGFTFAVEVENTGGFKGTDVVQVYLHDPVAQVTRPVARLIGYGRVEVEPGQVKRVEFSFHADLTAFSGRDGRRVVEPGQVGLWIAESSAHVRHVILVDITGESRLVGHDRKLAMGVLTHELEAAGGALGDGIAQSS